MRKLTAFCRDRFQTVLIPNQEAPDGSFPEELRRTKPYGYSLFNLDALAIVAQTLLTSGTICGSGSCPTAAAWRAPWRTCTRSCWTRKSGRFRPT